MARYFVTFVKFFDFRKLYSVLINRHNTCVKVECTFDTVFVENLDKLSVENLTVIVTHCKYLVFSLRETSVNCFERSFVFHFLYLLFVF